MTPRLVGGIAFATFALGLLTGGAGTILARDGNSPETTLTTAMFDHMANQDAGSMMSGGTGSGGMMSGGMMSGSMMGSSSSTPGMAGMMSGSMMVPSGNGMMRPGASTTPEASLLPGGGHDVHHPAASPDGTLK